MNYCVFSHRPNLAHLCVRVMSVDNAGFYLPNLKYTHKYTTVGILQNYVHRSMQDNKCVVYFGLTSFLTTDEQLQ